MDGDIDLSCPLTSLVSISAFRLLLSKLNPKRILTAEGPRNLLRDWRGLANLLNIPNDIASSISECNDKIGRVMKLWLQRNDDTATLGTLMDYLQQMDRYDIYDDIIDLARRGMIHGARPNTIGLCSKNSLALASNGYGKDNMILTYDDRRDGQPNYYHAYVLFAQEDWSFVRELLARMKAYNFKLCTEYDIDISHGSQYAPVSQLISDRCFRIIVVCSPDFLQSPANSLFEYFYHTVGIDPKKGTVIPIMYRPCEPPDTIKCVQKLVYKSDDEYTPYDFWRKVKETLDKVDLPIASHSKSSLNISDLFPNDSSSSFLRTRSSINSNEFSRRFLSSNVKAHENIRFKRYIEKETKKKESTMIRKMKGLIFGDSKSLNSRP